ncbi:hypothetical protein CSE16_11425 [Solibacillus sp. R5-41]|uniref:YqzG/YhdC family protein n=1 Tax=Solibacillus sp. R5-41 TaxID=2048654 RepID=UPI000C126B60|nr:YqzG/YhdC family protein [Solibacillus sp. R5-41]ATP40611.1 hypothetical protein CSE16_11425 [Solibacillus sp. R5-41]
MKTFLSIAVISCTLLLANFIFANSNDVEKVSQEVPPYAKWGGIAMQKTKEKYPQASIIDYHHIGREEGTDTSTEKFKLWLREGNKEFGVFINIKFDRKTEKVINITFKETTR